MRSRVQQRQQAGEREPNHISSTNFFHRNLPWTNAGLDFRTEEVAGGGITARNGKPPPLRQMLVAGLTFQNSVSQTFPYRGSSGYTRFMRLHPLHSVSQFRNNYDEITLPVKRIRKGWTGRKIFLFAYSLPSRQPTMRNTELVSWTKKEKRRRDSKTRGGRNSGASVKKM